MSNEEICRHYRLAANKRDDIHVLADLNTMSREEICRILEEGGETIPEAPKTKRTYNTKRGAEIEERLRKGQSVEHIAKNMGMTECGVMAWIKNHGKEELLEGVRDEALPPEEEARRMEEKRKRMIWEKKKEEKMRKVETEPKKETGQAAGGRDIWERVQAVVGAVPESAEWETRAKAFALCGALFREWLLEELKLRDEKEEP